MASATTARGGSVDLVIEDKAALLATTPAPTCRVDITDVHFEFDNTAEGGVVRRVRVSGVAWGSGKVTARLTLPGLPAASRQVNVTGSQTWTCTFPPLSAGVPVGTVARLHAEASDGGPCTATAALTVALSGTTVPLPADPASCEAGFEPGRNHFVAGYADRLVRSRFYVPLACAYFNPPMTHQTWMARAMSKVGLTRRQAYDAVEAFVDDLSASGSDALDEIDSGDSFLTSDGFRGAVDRAVSRLRRTVREALAGARGVAANALLGGGLEVRTLGPSRADDGGPEGSPYLGLQGTLGTPAAEEVGVADGFETYTLSGWVGTLFYDRLRFRPTGLVAGEQVYSLALAPGEEATLTQRSETKRSRSFEDVLDRTAEVELEFSSTWSTDVTQEDQNSQTSTVGGNLGISVGIPIESVEIGVNAGISSGSSNTISGSFQRARAYQTTGRYAAKAREQHKTTFKVSTDLTEELGSKRVLRNLNPARAMTLNFYKLYRKHRVLLERYDAKLAVGFGLDDPGKELRTEIEQEFAKLDPKIAPGACPLIPQGSSVSLDQLIENQNASDYGGDEWGRGHFETVLPPNTVLSRWDLEIVTWMVDDGSGNVYSAVTDQFFGKGGRWGFTHESMPIIGLGGAFASTIEVLMPEAYGAGWWTVSVTARMTWYYVPTETITNEVKACIEAEKKKIRDSFSPDRVTQILDEVKAGRLELVYQRLFQTVLLHDYYAVGANPPADLLERVRNFFDWNEAVVEYLPWWLTPAGKARRENLRQLLLSLPGDTRSDAVIDDMLIASAARVYLPIRSGQEKDALAFLIRRPSLQGHPLSACVDDFVKWREDNLGVVSYPLPTYDQVMDIGPARATPAGEPAWLHDWERARRKFLVLDEWSELLPTDGVHVEPALSACGGVDEFRAAALRSDLATAEAAREVDLARTFLENSLAENPAENTTVVIGDPAVRPPV